jgi:hypothetical protein
MIKVYYNFVLPHWVRPMKDLYNVNNCSSNVRYPNVFLIKCNFYV